MPMEPAINLRASNLRLLQSGTIDGKSDGTEPVDFNRALQSTLDLSEQLRFIKGWLTSLLAIDGLRYNHEHHALELTLGDSRPYHCDYRLTASDENLGAICFFRSRRFSEEDLKSIEIVLSQWILPLRNALLYRCVVEAALTDPLTGTGNRIAMDNALEREIQLATRYRNTFSLLVIDIDHFKRINDSHGHVAGDDVLRQVANTLREVTRKTDMIFRYGGEEFVVVLSNTEAEGAMIIAERIREAIAAMELRLDDQKVELSVSLGLSSLKTDSPRTDSCNVTENLEGLFDRADRALYKAKAKGRNRVELEL